MCLRFFFFKQKTAYEMRISDWSSDVCSSDLERTRHTGALAHAAGQLRRVFVRRVTGQAGQPDLEDRDLASQAWRQIGMLGERHQIGRASCRERVCQYV